MNTGLFLLRLLIGLTIAAHGSQKLLGLFGGGGIGGTGGYLESIGFRPGRRAAYAAGGTELVGGFLLAMGLLTPLAAAMVIGVMAVAGVAGHGGKGFFITRGGWEYCLIMAGAAAVLAFTGPGNWSLDFALGLPGGGNLWGLFAIALGIAGAAVQLATRESEIDLRDAGADTGDPVEAR